MPNKPIIERKEVRQYLVKLYCPNCVSNDNNERWVNDTELLKRSAVLMTIPPQYEYTCGCGYSTTSVESYPKLETEELAIND